jgi:hypothetical protein
VIGTTKKQREWGRDNPVLQLEGHTLLTSVTFSLNRLMALADEAISTWQLAISQILISTSWPEH